MSPFLSNGITVNPVSDIWLIPLLIAVLIILLILIWRRG
jgi:hypothetical protein